MLKHLHIRKLTLCGVVRFTRPSRNQRVSLFQGQTSRTQHGFGNFSEVCILSRIFLTYLR